VNWEPLLTAAREARSHSHSPYSRFAVGAAVLTEDGTIFAGANVENRSFGVTVCAERSAFAAAVSAGHRSFAGVAIVAESSPPAAPCGVCRETMAEFCAPSMPILLANPRGERRETSLQEIFPLPFRFLPGETSAS